jgi:hypothetical protein
MTDNATLEIASNFDRLPDGAVVALKVATVVLGGVLSERTLRREPPIPRRQISERRFGFRVGDIRTLLRGKVQSVA